MFKTIIVDDEEKIRSGMASFIDWEEYGFIIAGQAADGVEALQLYEALTPSLVITDIKMPRMDGLQLASELKNKNSQVKIIILSGYSDFSYAQEAIKYGVENYILKPVDRNELCRELAGIKDKLYSETQEKQRLIQKIESLKCYLFFRLVNSQISKDEANRQALEYGINLEASNYCAALLEISRYDELLLYNRIEDVQLIRYTIKNILNEILGDGIRGYLFEADDGRYGIIFMGRSKQISMEEVTNAIQGMLQCTEKSSRQNMIAGIGCPVKGINEIKASYQQALQALDYKLQSYKKQPVKNVAEEIMQYVQEHFHEDMSLKKLSDIFYLNPAYLGQLFKKETGEYFNEYVNKIRIQNAITMLKDARYSIKEIAVAVGYKYHDHFYRNFKEITGTNPSDYKNTCSGNILF